MATLHQKWPLSLGISNYSVLLQSSLVPYTRPLYIWVAWAQLHQFRLKITGKKTQIKSVTILNSIHYSLYCSAEVVTKQTIQNLLPQDVFPIRTSVTCWCNTNNIRTINTWSLLSFLIIYSITILMLEQIPSPKESHHASEPFILLFKPR